MSESKHKGGKFKPGVSGNPGGRPRSLTPEVKAVRKMSYEEFLTNFHKFGRMTTSELLEYIQRPDTNLFEKMTGRLIAKAGTGDLLASKLVMDKLWPRVPEMDININFTKMSTPQLLEKARDTLQKLEYLEAEVVNKTSDKD